MDAPSLALAAPFSASQGQCIEAGAGFNARRQA